MRIVLTLAAAVCLVAPAPPARATEAQPPAPDVRALGFMTGCWRSADGPSFSEELWGEPTAELMIGTARSVRDGRAVAYELLVVTRDADGAIVLTPYPNGERSEHTFRLTTLTGDHALFEAPEHDYPKRIHYRATETGLTARVDGGDDDPEGQEWTFRPAPCPSSAID